MSVGLLFSNHRHVSATHVAILRVTRTWIQSSRERPGAAADHSPPSSAAVMEE